MVDMGSVVLRSQYVQGRLEIFHSTVWRDVCDDDAHLNIAQVSPSHGLQVPHSPQSYLQTSVEISFLGSPKDSIFYSIARFFFIRMQYCAATRILWKIASRTQNRLQIIWISIEAHATLQWIPIWRPYCPLWTLSA